MQKRGLIRTLSRAKSGSAGHLYYGSPLMPGHHTMVSVISRSKSRCMSSGFHGELTCIPTTVARKRIRSTAGSSIPIQYKLQHAPMNMPVMGFWPAINASLQARGFCEYDGVKLAGLFGKYTLVVDFSTNLSFHLKMPYNPTL